MSDTPSDLTPKTAPIRKAGLSPREQKLQAMREKLANAKSGKSAHSNTSSAGFSGKSSFTGKKTTFQRKAT